MTRATSILAIVVSVATCLLGTPVHAQTATTLDGARDLYFRADFEQAERAFDAYLARPELRSFEAAEALRFLVALEMVLDERAAAEEHARALAAIDPSAVLPDGAPDEAVAVFAAARSELAGGSGLSIVIAPGGARATVTLRSTAALFRTLSIECRSGDARRTLDGATPTLELALDLTGHVVCEGTARSAQGAALLVVEAETDVGALASSAPAPPPPGDDTALIVGVTIGSVLVVAAVIVGVVLATASGDATVGPVVVRF